MTFNPPFQPSTSTLQQVLSSGFYVFHCISKPPKSTGSWFRVYAKIGFYLPKEGRVSGVSAEVGSAEEERIKEIYKELGLQELPPAARMLWTLLYKLAIYVARIYVVYSRCTAECTVLKKEDKGGTYMSDLEDLQDL